MTDTPRADRDAEAARSDAEPDRGLRDPEARAAWLRAWLPGPPAGLLGLGCGTGSLALAAAEQGHRVTGVGLSPATLERDRAKPAGRDAVFLTGDASAPPVGERRFDVVLVRHVLGALPGPGGRLVPVEGVCGGGSVTPVGVSADRLAALPAPLAGRLRTEPLSADPLLWGNEVADERYAAVVEF